MKLKRHLEVKYGDYFGTGYWSGNSGCNTGAPLLTRDPSEVTCKRCLAIYEKNQKKEQAS